MIKNRFSLFLATFFIAGFFLLSTPDSAVPQPFDICCQSPSGGTCIAAIPIPCCLGVPTSFTCQDPLQPCVEFQQACECPEPTPTPTPSLVPPASPTPTSAPSRTSRVTKTADTNDGVCDTDCSLREAIGAANALAGADTITVPAGTYTLSIAGTGEDANATGDLDISDDLTINGTTFTIIDGGALAHA